MLQKVGLGSMTVDGTIQFNRNIMITRTQYGLKHILYWKWLVPVPALISKDDSNVRIVIKFWVQCTRCDWQEKTKNTSLRTGNHNARNDERIPFNFNAHNAVSFSNSNVPVHVLWYDLLTICAMGFQWLTNGDPNAHMGIEPNPHSEKQVGCS